MFKYGYSFQLENQGVQNPNGFLKPKAKWREKVARFLQTNKVQYTIIVLVVLDSIIVIFELLIDMEIIIIPEDHHNGHDSEASTNGSSSHGISNHSDHHLGGGGGGGGGGVGGGGDLHPHSGPLHPFRNHSLLHTAIAATFRNHTTNSSRIHEEGGGGGGGGEGEHGGEGEGAEDEHHAPNKHLTEHVLHMASLTILTIFLIEVIFKIYAEGKHLLKHKAEVFDAIVVIVSFTMDITFTIVPVNEATKDYAGLLVLLRLWRVTRIINGVILSVKMDADKKVNAQKALRAKAEKQVQRLTDKLEKLTRENQKLRTRLAMLEGRPLSTASTTISGADGNGDEGGGTNNTATAEKHTDPPTTTTTTPEDDDDDDDDDDGSRCGGTSRDKRGKESRLERTSSSSTPQDDDTTIFFAPHRESSSHNTPIATPSPKSSDQSFGGGGSHRGVAVATTPPYKDSWVRRESPTMRYGAAMVTPPQSGRRSVGSGGSSRTPPTESQQLLSFEEPVSENQELDIRGSEISLSQGVVGGKLVPGVS